jgi:hypothetical protein
MRNEDEIGGKQENEESGEVQRIWVRMSNEQRVDSLILGAGSRCLKWAITSLTSTPPLFVFACLG